MDRKQFIKRGVIVGGVLAVSPFSLMSKEQENSYTEPILLKENATNNGINILDFYIGHWISDTKDFQENPGHFTYDLSWFDKSKTLARMTIKQEYNDGTSILLWSGFKGWHPNDNYVYYNGYSTRGRFCHGDVTAVNDELITAYEGVATNGSVTKVKDVFRKQNNTGFISTTFILKK